MWHAKIVPVYDHEKYLQAVYFVLRIFFFMKTVTRCHPIGYICLFSILLLRCDNMLR
jgi:hypothetical protein